MIVKNLNLKNFRNYENESFCFDDKVNIIYGNNAQGKTNILEGIYIFSLGKSNRAAKDAEVIGFGHDEARAEMIFEDSRRENSARIDISRSKRKSIFINDIPVRKNSELVGKFNGVYFGPEYLDLIKGGPKKRRKNIDIIVSQLKVSYFSALSEMKNILEQKSAVLKSDRKDKIILSVLNEKLLAASLVICKLRFEYLKKIEEKANILQKEISSEKEDFNIRYVSPIGIIEDFEEEKFLKAMEEKINSALEKEMFLGECIVGPHRDDIEFKINGLEVKNYASQGQQKTAVLVQKIAEVELFKEEKGEYPVLLLDDIMSELDINRREFVTDKIKNMQIFITCTEKEKFDTFQRGKFFEIENGKIIKEG